MLNYFYKVLNFLKNIFVLNNVLPPRKDPNEVTFLFELQNKIKNFRLDNGLMPLNYSFALEYFAQESADNNYRSKVLVDAVHYTSVDVHLRMQGIYLKNFTLLTVYSDGNLDDYMRLILSNSRYRAALLDGYLTTIATAKCGNYLSIFLAQ